MCCRFAELIVKYEGKHGIFCVFHKSLLVTVCYEFLQRMLYQLNAVIDLTYILRI